MNGHENLMRFSKQEKVYPSFSGSGYYVKTNGAMLRIVRLIGNYINFPIVLFFVSCT